MDDVIKERLVLSLPGRLLEEMRLALGFEAWEIRATAECAEGASWVGLNVTERTWPGPWASSRDEFTLICGLTGCGWN